LHMVSFCRSNVFLVAKTSSRVRRFNMLFDQFLCELCSAWW
jgi:hypothetical protein